MAVLHQSYIRLKPKVRALGIKGGEKRKAEAFALNSRFLLLVRATLEKRVVSFPQHDSGRLSHAWLDGSRADDLERRRNREHDGAWV